MEEFRDSKLFDFAWSAMKVSSDFPTANLAAPIQESRQNLIENFYTVSR